MSFDERKKWKSVVTSRGVATEKVRRNTGKGRCPLCLGEEKTTHILLDLCEN